MKISVPEASLRLVDDFFSFQADSLSHLSRFSMAAMRNIFKTFHHTTPHTYRSREGVMWERWGICLAVQHFPSSAWQRELEKNLWNHKNIWQGVHILWCVVCAFALARATRERWKWKIIFWHFLCVRLILLCYGILKIVKFFLFCGRLQHFLELHPAPS